MSTQDLPVLIRGKEAMRVIRPAIAGAKTKTKKKRKRKKKKGY